MIVLRCRNYFTIFHYIRSSNVARIPDIIIWNLPERKKKEEKSIQIFRSHVKGMKLITRDDYKPLNYSAKHIFRKLPTIVRDCSDSRRKHRRRIQISGHQSKATNSWKSGGSCGGCTVPSRSVNKEPRSPATTSKCHHARVFPDQTDSPVSPAFAGTSGKKGEPARQSGRDPFHLQIKRPRP